MSPGGDVPVMRGWNSPGRNGGPTARCESSVASACERCSAMPGSAPEPSVATSSHRDHGKRPVLLCVDVEPEGRAIDPEAPVDWDGFEQVHEYLAGLRPRLAAATGHPAHFSWFLRMDPQIERVHGS